MGFIFFCSGGLRMALHVIVKLIAVIALLFFAAAIVFPWYGTTYKMESVFDTTARGWMQFIYTLGFATCSSDFCTSDWNLDFWDFDVDQVTRLFFGVGWFGVIIAAICVLLALVKGSPTITILSALCSGVAVVSFLFVSFGFKSEAGVSLRWGPSFGWFFAIGGFICTLIMVAGSCLCKPRQQQQGIGGYPPQSMNPYPNYPPQQGYQNYPPHPNYNPNPGYNTMPPQNDSNVYGSPSVGSLY